MRSVICVFGPFYPRTPAIRREFEMRGIREGIKIQ